MKMETNETCNLCIKMTFELRSSRRLTEKSPVPTTFNADEGRYVWIESGLMACAVIPQERKPNGVEVDVLICMDEDDLDDVNLKPYVEDFFKSVILPKWRGFYVHHVHDPVDSHPGDAGCVKKKELSHKS